MKLHSITIQQIATAGLVIAKLHSITIQQIATAGLVIANAALWLSIYDAWQRIG